MKHLWRMLLVLYITGVNCIAGTYVEGVPITVQKSDNGDSRRLIFIQMQSPVVSGAQCTSQDGVVFHDSHDSSAAALSFALTALVSGVKFRCYVGNGECSKITGAAKTYPVCDNYPALVK